MMATGGGQEEGKVSQVDLRIEEVIGEVGLTGVQSDAPLDSSATPYASVTEALCTDSATLARHIRHKHPTACIC